MPSRRVADLLPVLPADADGDEALDDPDAVDDAERGVAGTDEVAHTVHDQLEDRVDFEHAGDTARRSIERSKPATALADLGPRPGGVNGKCNELRHLGGGAGRTIQQQ